MKRMAAALLTTLVVIAPAVIGISLLVNGAFVFVVENASNQPITLRLIAEGSKVGEKDVEPNGQAHFLIFIPRVEGVWSIKCRSKANEFNVDIGYISPGEVIAAKFVVDSCRRLVRREDYVRI